MRAVAGAVCMCAQVFSHLLLTGCVCGLSDEEGSGDMVARYNVAECVWLG